ncbi:MAG: NADP-dependent malic enzyme [Alicycliphilus sp.]|jgi:malate dehydrogenase (oxaloacetate-decarboxylating)(NADP+)|uniref:NADP-dependent malic enzyme n=1 Tax=Diaphorobacter limosus TaxID=3036128 RepID=A0ABZ0J712_9BURK|nr:NADP-dependent malic enzyme [Diaphorobacter sp. Y-1]MBP6752068.1 NADP-dependent malic enzyme [Alicycliphilus sp.]MBP7325257.1 NADP-dependent malic enzyme [Alicycliphilus sp.]MBP7327807.1 NADP-dependent malic enzyme [Alicycliphilus sp.]MBP8779683.1 NADP-dependent malic enzyme [Alicycliphilus sp.]TXJ10268.1 MAG: NADP-dependent malic enzyme [Alicycliphilus sp.]
MNQPLSAAEVALREAALEYHRNPSKGKISVTPTKPLSNQRDLSLAYSPGVAYPCLDIQADPSKAFDYTSRGNLVGVITNGTAVLGLGDIGPLAGKPVMEGKGCLFKKFAGVDVFDIELDARDPDKIIEIVAALEPTLGGINLEDIKAPECFYIEQELSKRMNIPVFHDDQHGTAIISSSALLNGLELVGKQIDQVKVAVSGAGAAAIACVDVMVGLGVKREHVFMVDSKGVIYEGRPGGMDASKARYAQKTEARTLADVVNGADVFLGCSAPGVLTAEMVKTMADKPIILALANPEPEIRPELAKAVRPDCIIATGRSDYPNQVNNVLCFPYIFRGALDCGATKITEAMKLACVRQIAALAKENISEEVANAYAGKELAFGPDYLIPTPFDSRLILKIAPAVAQAALESGVASRPITDMDAYRSSLTRFVYQTGMLMRPVFNAAKSLPKAQKRVAYADGEDERALRAAQFAIDDNVAHPILIGRPAVIAARIAKAGLRMEPGKDVEVCDPSDDPRFRQYWETYYQLMKRDGATPEMAKAAVRRSNTIIASLMVKLGDADAMICGLVGTYETHLERIHHILGHSPDAKQYAALNALMTPNNGTLFITDTYVNEDPTAEELADIAWAAVQEVQRFGIPPKVAFLSHSSFGSSKRASARKMRAARDLFVARHPDIECDGELHGDAALEPKVRNTYLQDSTLTAPANLLVCPNIDAANILYNVLKTTTSGGVTVGPVLMGTSASAHILTPAATVRRVLNMTALAVVNSATRNQ